MDAFLAAVERPVHYIGGEYNSVVKDWPAARARMAFCFPDTYEIGMSHLGLRILYEAVNREQDLLCERCFLPREDMRQQLLTAQQPLSTLESGRPLADFDILGFTLQYELTYTNVLDMLYLAGLPLPAAERAGWPLVIAGGPCAYNPEPLSDFIDIFCIGESERQLPALLHLAARVKEAGGDKRQLLLEALKLPGLYIPAFYEARYDAGGHFTALAARPGAPTRIRKTLIQDMNTAPFPLAPLLPHTQVVHDRVMLEIMRGCGRGCRFCQAGIIYRPVREKEMDILLEQARQAAAHSGYEDLGLMSLSTADYSRIEPLMRALSDAYGACGMGISLPSLRVDAFSVGLAAQSGQVRKSGLTFAPEAASQRLRDIINKGVTEEDIIAAVSAAFTQGYSSLKLYFMIGLPEETMEDIAAIADLCRRITALYRQLRPAQIKKPLKISLGVASFVPKAHTPFQWRAQESAENLQQKQQYLLRLTKPLKQVTLRYHDTEGSLLEAAFARGDRRLAAVLLSAWRLGCRADGWSEHFKPDRWREAFAAHGLKAEDYACRAYKQHEPLPWQHIESGVSEGWLWREYEKARQGALTADCRAGICSGCGICATLDCRVQLAASAAEPPSGEAGGAQRRAEEFDAPKSAGATPPAAAENRQRWRMRLAVTDAAAWLSHLDLLKTMEKAVRRAVLPIAFSQGFNPHMLISWGPAHPVGLSGDSEYLDLIFAAAPIEGWRIKLNAVLPAGLRVVAAARVFEQEAALMAAIDGADYALELSGDFDAAAVDANIATLLARKSCMIKRESPKGRKELDIRPALLCLTREGNTLYFSCRLGAAAAPKALELARIVAPAAIPGQARRLAMYINGKEPLPITKPINNRM